MSFSTYKCIDGYNEIKEKLGDTYDSINTEYKGYLEEMRDASEEFVVTKGEWDVSNVTETTLKQVIGKDGCYFILTTNNYGLDFIWYNKDTKKIEIWGPINNVKKGWREINKRIVRFNVNN